MPVEYIRGDITLDAADLLVNPVNAVGVMGKGVALAFRQRWPEIMIPYKEACEAKFVSPGDFLALPLPGHAYRYWGMLVTKDHWRNPSQYHWVFSGLRKLRAQAMVLGVRSIAIPPPGCGLGGLEWEKVQPMLLNALESFDLRIYLGPK